jgi:putative transposase
VAVVAVVAAVCDRRFVPPSSFKLLSALIERRYNHNMNSGEQIGGGTPPLQPRLKRLDRLFTRYPLYFVTACTEDRKPILANAKVHENFRKFCETGLTRGVFVGKYVLMPDHLHLFVAFGEEYEAALVEARSRRSQTGATEDEACSNCQSQTDATEGGAVAAVCDRRPANLRLSLLSEWMKSLKNALSKTFRGQNIPAPHWQKGFFDHVMRSEESYSEKWLYVAENPVRKNLVIRPEDWPYQGEVYPLEARGHV